MTAQEMLDGKGVSVNDTNIADKEARFQRGVARLKVMMAAYKRTQHSWLAEMHRRGHADASSAMAAMCADLADLEARIPHDPLAALAAGACEEEVRAALLLCADILKGGGK